MITLCTRTCRTKLNKIVKGVCKPTHKVYQINNEKNWNYMYCDKCFMDVGVINLTQICSYRQWDYKELISL